MTYEPSPAITDCDRAPFSNCDISSLDQQPPARRHGVTRIHRQIHDDLFKLPGIGLDRPQLRFKIRPELDNIFADQPPKHAIHVGDNGIQIDHLHGRELAPAERKKLPRQTGCSIGRLLDFFHVASGRLIRGQTAQDQFTVPANDRQQIIEVMCNTARKPAYRFHFLRLPQLAFRLIQRLLGSGAFAELPQLESDVRQHIQQLLIRLPHLPTKKLDCPFDLTADANRKTKRAVQPDFRRRLRPGQIKLRGNISDPHRLPAFPNPARQPDTRREGLRPSRRDELIGVERRCAPMVETAQKPRGLV